MKLHLLHLSLLVEIVPMIVTAKKALNATMGNARHLNLSLALLTQLAARLPIVTKVSIAWPVSA